MLAQQIETAAGADQALAAIVAYFGADTGTVHLLRPDGLLHMVAATPGMPDAVLTLIRTIPIGKGMAGLAVERREPVDSCNIQNDATGDVRPGARATAMSGAIVVPIFSGDEVVGALGVASRAERTFTVDETAALIEAGRALACRPQADGAP